MNKNFAVAAIVAACLVAPPAFAATIKELFESARSNDPVLGGAQASYQARRQVVPQARAALLPQIGVSAATSWSDRSILGANIDPALASQSFQDKNWSASLRQPLVDVASWYTFRSAKSLAEQAEADVEAVEQNLIVRLASAYLDVLRIQALLESTQAEEEAVQRQLEQVQQRFDVGLVAITDVLEATAAFDSAVVRRVQATGDHDIFFETLRTITGVAYTEVDRLDASLPIVDPAPDDEEVWVQKALQENLSIRSARFALEAAERDLRSKLSGHLPTIDAVASHSEFRTDGLSFFGDTDQDVISIQAQLPIFQGGFTHSRYREARFRVEESRQRLIERELVVTRNTRNLYRAVETDVVRVQARIKGIKSTESALEATETGYEVGTRNIVDVLRAQQALFASQFDYADSRYNYVANLLLLKQQAGTLEVEDIYELSAFGNSTDPVRKLSSLSGR